MSNVRIKVANKIASIVERRSYRIKQAKAKRLLHQLRLDKKATASVAAGDVLNILTDFAKANPGLTIGTGVGLTAGGIGLARKKKRKAIDYLTYLGGGGTVGALAGYLWDKYQAYSNQKAQNNLSRQLADKSYENRKRRNESMEYNKKEETRKAQAVSDTNKRLIEESTARNRINPPSAAAVALREASSPETQARKIKEENQRKQEAWDSKEREYKATADKTRNDVLFKRNNSPEFINYRKDVQALRAKGYSNITPEKVEALCKKIGCPPGELASHLNKTDANDTAKAVASKFKSPKTIAEEEKRNKDFLAKQERARQQAEMDKKRRLKERADSVAEGVALNRELKAQGRDRPAPYVPLALSTQASRADAEKFMADTQKVMPLDRQAQIDANADAIKRYKDMHNKRYDSIIQLLETANTVLQDAINSDANEAALEDILGE